ncbi:MAG: extracellular solute-binding protein [Anaeroplasmataceae bacterium]|nr:extracellular solute-binding protein [Anaeroplasmataceae bacterium]
MKKVLTMGLIALAGIGLFTSCGHTKERVIISGACEEERIAFMLPKLQEHFPEYDITFQYVGTGELVSKLQGEGKNTEMDIFYDLDVCNAEMLLNENPSLFIELGDLVDKGVYIDGLYKDNSSFKYAVDIKTNVAVLVNKKILEQKGLTKPTSFQDLIKEEYKGNITIGNPKSSGTSYTIINGIASTMDADKIEDYYANLNKNVKEYTTSGSAPIKSVNRGEVAIACGMLWQCVEFANENPDLEWFIPEEGSPYALYAMGIIEGHQSEVTTKVFQYLFDELNPQQVNKYAPDKIYKSQSTPEIPNYPTAIKEVVMKGMYDFKYKQDLLDSWKY